MAGMAVQDKISKINAELARLELEMELDHGGLQVQCKNLGANGWFKWLTQGIAGGLAALDPAAAISDANKFHTNVLEKVCKHSEIAATPASVIKTPGVLDRFTAFALKPVEIWSITCKGKHCLVVFWASTTVASYAVVEGDPTGSAFKEHELPATQVWSDRAKVESKNFAFIMGRLYADILTVCGHLKF